MTATLALPMHETIGPQLLQRRDWREALLWAGAFVVVTGVQVAGFYLVSNLQTAPEIPGAPPPAIMIELAEVAVAPQVEDIAAEVGELAPAQEAAESVVPVPAEQVPDEVPPETAEPLEAVQPDPVEPNEVTPVEQSIAEPVEPEPAIASVDEPLDEPAEPEVLEAAQVTEVRPDVVEPIEPVDPIEEIVPDLIESEIAEVYLPAPVVASSTIEQKRQAFAEAARAEEQAKKKAQQKPKVEQKQAAASKVTAPKSVDAAPADRVAASETNTATKRTPKVSPQKWQSQVIALLNRMKRYPADARKRGEQGIPRLQFSIDRSGRVVSARIVRSSGFASLDQAAIEMVNRASPLPPPPDSMPDSRITLTVPVNFNLK